MQRFLFHLIGISSTLGFLGILILVAQHLLTGGGATLSDFFQKYRGAEPFMIFIFPVLMVGSVAWSWDLVRRIRK